MRTRKMTMTSNPVDLIVVGAGPAGLAAATEVAGMDGRVVIVDESPMPGGRLGGQIHHIIGRSKKSPEGWSIGAQKAESLLEKASAAGVNILNGYSVWGIFPEWYTGISPVEAGYENGRDPDGYKSKAVILATGATQNAMVFPGWTLPGVITAGAAQQLINVNGILPGRHSVIIGIDPINLAVGQILSVAGRTPKGILISPNNGLNPDPTNPSEAVDRLANYSCSTTSTIMNLFAKLTKRLSRPVAACYPCSGVKFDGMPLMLRKTILSAQGTDRVETITVADIDYRGNIKSGTEEQWKVDAVITSAGLSPQTELAQVAGVPLINLRSLGGWVPVHGGLLQTPVSGLFVAGSITGVESAEVAQAQGRLAGVTAAHYLGLMSTDELKRSVPVLKADISKARDISIPFLPGISKNRIYMQQFWKRNYTR